MQKAQRKEAAAIDVAAVEKLLDVPQDESAAFYLERYNETQKIASTLRDYNNAGVCDLRDLENRLSETLPTLARRLAYADDLAPLERFEYFVRYIYSCDVEEMRAALEVETARDATSEIDRARKPFLENHLLETRLKRAVNDARKNLPEVDRHRSQVKIQTPISPELEATFAELFDEIAERVDDGALPWELEKTWAFHASYLASVVGSYVGPEYATRLHKQLCAALADDEDETSRRYLEFFQTAVRNEELKTRFDGFPVEISATLLDGTPFDWASYRGAPVLIEIVRVDADGDVLRRAPLDVASLDAYEKAGLRRVCYVAKPLETASSYAERIRNFVGDDAIPLVAPTELNATWLVKLRVSAHWVLVDADGKTLAACPKRPMNRDDAPEIGDALKRLFPNVSVESAK